MTALLKHQAKINAELVGDKLMNTSTDNYNTTANHNLSSLLSQIQDNGPAHSAPTGQKKARGFVAKENIRSGTTGIQQQIDEQYTNDKVSISSHKPQQQPPFLQSNADKTKKEISPGIWLQLLLLLISAALLASTLFRLDAQTNNFEDSLSVVDEKIQQSVNFQKQHSSPGASKISATLQAVQKELQLIKTDYSALDKKYVELSQNNTAVDVQQGASAQDDISIFKYEILSLKSELQAVKNKLKITNIDKGSDTEKTASNGLTITLASLTNKNKAEQIVQQLYAEGLLPTIKQAVVNGERVYRLSVSGFYDRNEAESFIRKADKKYGMKDSRIRKS